MKICAIHQYCLNFFLNMSIQYLCKKSKSKFLLKTSKSFRVKIMLFFLQISCAFIANKFSFCSPVSVLRIWIHFSIFLSLIQYVREDCVLLLHKFSEMILWFYLWMLERKRGMVTIPYEGSEWYRSWDVEDDLWHCLIVTFNSLPKSIHYL